jgi:hypothetical protein
MNLFPIKTYLQKMDVVTLLYPKTNLPERERNIFPSTFLLYKESVKNRGALCRKIEKQNYLPYVGHQKQYLIFDVGNFFTFPWKNLSGQTPS